MTSTLRTLLMLVLVVATTGCARMGFRSSTDLLDNISTSTDAVEGTWRFERRALMSEHTAHARIALPVIPYGDYRLRMEFSRVIGDGSVNLVLPVGDTQVLVVIDGGTADDPQSGLELVDGRPVGDNSTSDIREIDNHRRYRLEATVRTRASEGSVDIDIDGLPFVRWTGAQASLSLPPEWALDGTATLGVGSHHAVVQVHSASIQMLASQKGWVSK